MRSHKYTVHFAYIYIMLLMSFFKTSSVGNYFRLEDTTLNRNRMAMTMMGGLGQIQNTGDVVG